MNNEHHHGEPRVEANSLLPDMTQKLPNMTLNMTATEARAVRAVVCTVCTTVLAASALTNLQYSTVQLAYC